MLQVNQFGCWSLKSGAIFIGFVLILSGIFGGAFRLYCLTTDSDKMGSIEIHFIEIDINENTDPKAYI